MANERNKKRGKAPWLYDRDSAQGSQESQFKTCQDKKWIFIFLSYFYIFLFLI